MRAYLYAWLFCLGIALGSMSVVMLHHLTGGAWGYLVRRPAEAAMGTLPLLALLFIPIAIGFHALFPWARPADVAQHAVLRYRQTLFAPKWVLLRAVIYFAIWIFWGWRLRRLSFLHDETGDANLLRRLSRLSGAGFVIYFATMSLAAADWIASREVDWYSSTFGLLVLVGQAVTATAFLLVVLALLRDESPVREIAETDRVHDLGNLLLTIVVLWAYIAFAQLLVIWMGNMQDDAIWYVHRNRQGWGWIGRALIVLHFAVPFVLLLFQSTKRSIRALACVAGGVLFMRLIDVLWMIAPSSLDEYAHGISWLDFISPLALCGLWFAAFVWLLARRPLIPLGYRTATEPIVYGTQAPTT
jgi:hypothetical protein